MQQGKLKRHRRCFAAPLDSRDSTGARGELNVYSFVMSTILCLRAGPNDERLKSSFLYLIPDAEKIQAFLGLPSSGNALRHKYFFHENPNVASYVSATGNVEFCMTVLNVRKELADGIAAQLNDLSKMITLPAFQDVVEDVLGESINPQHPKGSYLTTWWTG